MHGKGKGIVMSDVKKYLIDGMECTQTFLTIEKTEQILELLNDLSFREMGSPGVVVQKLFKEKKFDSFMGIILEHSATNSPDFRKMKLFQAVEVIGDFLSSDEMSQIISGIFSAITLLGGRMEEISKSFRSE